MGNRGSSAVETRTVRIGKQDEKTYPDNRVISYKYTAWNFLFKNLFEQFRRVANLYFLCMGVIASLIPDSPVSSWTTLVPLLFVVTVTAVKQGYEDYRRHRADNKINNSLVTVVRRGVSQEIVRKKVCVGDMVKVGEDSEVPCDLVMLISSHQDSKGYVTTANLDGETNLKTVECPMDTDLTVEHLAHLEGTISCEPPTVDLYQFHGNITLSLTQGENDEGNWNPAVEKESYPMESLRGDSRLQRQRSGFGKLHLCPQSEYSAPLSADNLLLRGSYLRNTEYVFGCAVYTGQETKLALNSNITINKFSILERSINAFLLFFFVLLLAEVLISVGVTFYLGYITKTNDCWYLSPEGNQNSTNFIEDIFVYIVLYYYIIPISLYVTIEMQRFCGAFFFEWDLGMFDQDQPAICNTSDLNEELGQIQYLFSDKTGTLTENDMQFRRCTIEGSLYCEEQGQLLLLPPSGNTLTGIALPTWPPEVEQFLLSMALCHSVQTLSELRPNKSSELQDQEDNKLPEYRASSPDEKALVEAAARCGVVFMGTEAGVMSVSVLGRTKKYKKLQTLEFTSDRKRMSVILLDSADKIWLFCKGAEVAMMPLIVSGHREETVRHYNDFSMRGLRTLVFGMRQIDEVEYRTLARELRASRGVIDSVTRETQLAKVCGSLEQGLHLQGATAVEDRLQDKVPDTLELLRTAGIKVWILTGDKVETALNIAYSCGHFKLGTRRLDLIELTNETDCVNTLRDLRYQMASESMAQYGLVLDGGSVRLALTHDPELLREIAINCATVLCCRLSPKQKAEIVSLVKTSEDRPTVAAVGDGANDVSMIQEANIGLGIMGKEGRQAVRCSDFGFARFYCIGRAILVHGQWYYLRASILVQYFFYKNIVFITPQVYFSLFNGVSPQPLYLNMFLVLYNTIFTSAPIMLYSLFEQNYPATTLLARPELYKLQCRNRLMSWRYFAEWTIVGVWHSLVVYFVPAWLLEFNPVMLHNDTPVSYIAFGTTIMQNVVVVVNLKILMQSTYWTPLFVVSVVLTIFLFFLFCCIFNMIPIETSVHSLYFVYFNLILSPSFWFQSLLTVVVSLLPDMIFRLLRNQKFRRPRLPSWLPTRRKGIFVLPTLESKA